MRVDLFDYELPKDLIAQQPVEKRDHSRLMVLDRATERIHHEPFHAIGKFLKSGDCLVVNDTRVLPARLVGRRTLTGGRWEGLFLRKSADGWEMLCKTRGRASVGERIAVEGSELQLELRGKTPEGAWLVAPLDPVEPEELFAAVGHVPLPPYIRDGRDSPFDRERYQTVYAEQAGSIAAPTAGLHFTPELLADLAAQGVSRESVTLHVGVGTFSPVKVEEVADHRMHAEACSISAAAAERINAARASGGRVVAVGTTSARTLETAVEADGTLSAFAGETSLFATPGFQFRAVDMLITNFHLPKSTLLMLVAAFAGREFVMKAYQEAVKRKYRFYSYGDAMLVV